MKGAKDDDAEKLSDFIQNLPQRSHYQPSNPSERYATPDEKQEELHRSEIPPEESPEQQVVFKQPSLGKSSKQKQSLPGEAKYEVKKVEEKPIKQQTPP